MNEMMPGADASKTWKAVYMIVERPGLQKKLWIRIGTAFVNHDQSLNVRLDALPTNGQLHVRDANDNNPAFARRPSAPIGDLFAPAGSPS